MKTPRGTARRERRRLGRITHIEQHRAANINAGMEERPFVSHEWDEDACCVHCGYDGAEGWHLRSLGYGPEEYGSINHCEERAAKLRIDASIRRYYENRIAIAYGNGN